MDLYSPSGAFQADFLWFVFCSQTCPLSSVQLKSGKQNLLNCQFRLSSSGCSRLDSVEKCRDPTAVSPMGKAAISGGMHPAVASISWANQILSEYECQKETQTAALWAGMP